MEKRIFTIGGFNYEAPIKIGAGVRAQYSEALMKAILKSENGMEILKMIAEVSKANTANRPADSRISVPEELQEAMLTEKVLQDRYSEVVKTFMVAQIYTYRLVMLEAILKPCAGSPTVKEAYDVAEDSEIEAVELFFSEKSADRIPTGHSTAVGSHTKAKAKKKAEA